MRRLANTIIDHIGELGYHVKTWLSDNDPDWCELIAVDLNTGERWRVESDDIYVASCRLAEHVGMECEDG